jgi:CRP-like cAMP-binding protein
MVTGYISKLQYSIFAIRRWRGSSWACGTPFPALRSDGTASILVLEGLLVREVVIAETRWAELIGPGDLLELTDVDLGGPFIQVELVCTVTEASRIALLDARFAAMLARWPGVNLSLVERLEQRFLRLSTQATICQLPCVEARLLALLWHLAERWGRIGPNGVILPLSLLHRTLALLVGPYLAGHGGTGLTGGPHGELHYPMLRTTHLQGVSVATQAVPQRDAGMAEELELGPEPFEIAM